MFIKCLSLDEMFWSESDQLLTMTCYLVFDIFGRFHDPPTMNRKYTQWSVLNISSLCFWTVANDDDDHCFQSPALELIPMDMTGSESKQKEADGRKSTERNKISQNLPQGSSTPLTIIRWHIHHRWKHMTWNLLSSVFPVLCFWTQKQSWERSVLFMFACVKKKTRFDWFTHRESGDVTMINFFWQENVFRTKLLRHSWKDAQK